MKRRTILKRLGATVATAGLVGSSTQSAAAYEACMIDCEWQDCPEGCTYCNCIE